MKTIAFSRLLTGILALSIVAAFTSCKDDENGATPLQDGIYLGEKAAIGQGNAQTYVQVGDDGAPVEVGILVPEAVINNLEHEMAMLSLDLPSKAKTLTAYQHMLFDWMPHGHEPAGVFDKPHFDLHFYYTNEEDRMAIGPNDTIQFMRPVAEGYIPAPYINIGGVPQMGAHWIDPTAPVFNGEPFTTTLLYGSYDGEVTFLEPMMTLEHIKAVKTYQEPILQPGKFPVNGKYYPTVYGVTFDSGRKEYRFYVGGFLKS